MVSGSALGLLGRVETPVGVVSLITGREEHMSGADVVVIEVEAFEVEDIADILDLGCFFESLGEDADVQVRLVFVQVLGLEVEGGVDQLDFGLKVVLFLFSHLLGS